MKIKAHQSETVNDMEFASKARRITYRELQHLSFMEHINKEEAEKMWPKEDPLKACRDVLDQSIQDFAKDTDKHVEDWSFVSEAKDMLDERGD